MVNSFYLIVLVYGNDEILTEMELVDLQRAVLVKRCVLEAIRLHSPGTITRRVTESFTLHVCTGLYHLIKTS